MSGQDILAPILELGPYEKYRGSFPSGCILEGESILLEWRPSRALWGKGHPILGVLMFPGAFTLPFTLLIPVLAFFGILSFFLEHFYEIGLLLIVMLAMVVYGSGLLAWKRTFLAVTDDAVYIRTGVLIPGTRRAGFGEISEIRIKKTLFERITGRGTLHFILNREGRFGRKRLRWPTINHPHEVRSALEGLIFSKRE
jgi:hypothetical protein